MAEGIEKLPMPRPTLSVIVREAITNSVGLYFFPLTLSWRSAYRMYKWAIALLATLTPLRREQVLKHALNQVLKDVPTRKEKLVRELDETQINLQWLELAQARAHTHTREQELEQELNQKRATSREVVRRLNNSLEELDILEQKLNQILHGVHSLEHLDPWVLKLALEWTGQQGRQLEEERKNIQTMAQKMRSDLKWFQTQKEVLPSDLADEIDFAKRSHLIRMFELARMDPNRELERIQERGRELESELKQIPTQMRVLMWYLERESELAKDSP